MDEILPAWFDYVLSNEVSPWALFMIVPPLIIGITASYRVLKLNNVGKAGLKVASSNASEHKSSGDDRLQTDDLLLNDVGIEGAKVIGADELKFLHTINPSAGVLNNDENKKLGLFDSSFEDRRLLAEEGKKFDSSESIVNAAGFVTDEANSSGVVDSTTPASNLGQDESKKAEAPESTMSLDNFVGDTPRNKSEYSNDTIDSELTKSIGFVDPINELKILERKSAGSLKESNPTRNNENSEDHKEDKNKHYLDNIDLVDSTTATVGKLSETLNIPLPTRGASSKPPETEKLDVHSKSNLSDGDSLTKKSILDFNPNFVNATPDRKLNIGRPDSEEKNKDKEIKKESGSNKESGSKTYFLEKSESEEGLSYIGTPKKAAPAESQKKCDVPIRTSSADKMPDLISPQNYNELSNKQYGFGAIQSIINAKNSEKYGDKFHLSKLNESKIQSRPFPVDIMDPLSIPDYRPSISDKTTLPKDFVKFTEPATITSYDLVPGPTILRTVGNIWKYVPLLGTQFVATFIYSIQALLSSYDRKLKYPNLYPYYYLLNKYGPMVRLHGPIGADILILAVNGQDFPIVHIKTKANKRQSIFDSLNVYRKSATPLSYMLNTPNLATKIPDNPMVDISQHYATLEKITDDFIKRRRFIRNYTGIKEEDDYNSDLLRWAMQCTTDVYFKTKRDFFDQHGSDSGRIIEIFAKMSNSLRLCETGIQLWRAFTTFSWLDLVEYGKEMDRFIINEVSQCMSAGQGTANGSVVELLLSTEELKSTDLLTALLDLLLINVNVAATTAGFLLHYLSKTPQVQRTLFKEVSGVLPKGGGNIDQADLEQLTYLNACITETLRLIPPFPFLNRQLQQDTRIHGFQIPRGTFIQMVNVMPCARGDVCNDEIGRFQAERWTDKGNTLSGDPLAGLPQWSSFPKFNRDLIVKQVALLIVKVVREYRVEYPTKEIYADGMVLQGPTIPFNFGFIERVI